MQEGETDLREIELILLRPRKPQTWLVEMFVGLSMIVLSSPVYSTYIGLRNYYDKVICTARAISDAHYFTSVMSSMPTLD